MYKSFNLKKRSLRAELWAFHTIQPSSINLAIDRSECDSACWMVMIYRSYLNLLFAVFSERELTYVKKNLRRSSKGKPCVGEFKGKRGSQI